MKTFKSFIASAAIAISTLGFVAVSAPAHAFPGVVIIGAGGGHNGVSLQGISLQGVSLQGISLQGVTLQGVTLQGVRLNGMRVNGTELLGAAKPKPFVQTGRVLAVALPGGEMVRVK